MSIEIQAVSPSTLAAIDKRLVSNVGIVLFKDFIVMVDAGMRPDTARMLREQLENNFERPVKFLCLTHYHADHAFSLKAFKDAAILGSKQVVDNLQNSPDWTRENFASMKASDPDGGGWLNEVEFILPSVIFTDRLDIVDKDKTVEFHHTGGHTSCSVYGYFPSEKVLFAGDLVFSGKLPYAGDPSFDPETWMDVLKTWLKMDIEHVVPGHGSLTDLGEVRKHLEFFLALKQNTLAAIKAGKGSQDIVMPDLLPPGENQSWGVKKTLEQWHAYYQLNISRFSNISV
jgi:glyoxylase-like metal-dependent hydrolase (beta-lactamase superfamily II)